MIELVQRQPDAVVGHAVLREVVGADLLAAVAGADHAAALGAELLPAASPVRSRTAGSAARARALARFLICDFSSWQETTSPVGRCVMRTAE